MVLHIPLDTRIDGASIVALEAQETTFSDEALRDPLLRARRSAAVLATIKDANALIGEIEERLHRAGYVLLTGAPTTAANTLPSGLTAAFGELGEPYNQPWSRVVRQIRPCGARKRGGTSRAAFLDEFLHTDGTDWPRPNDLTCLLCVRPDCNGGGRSRILSLAGALDAIERTAGGRVVLRELWERPLKWILASELSGGTVAAPAFATPPATFEGAAGKGFALRTIEGCKSKRHHDGLHNGHGTHKHSQGDKSLGSDGSRASETCPSDLNFSADISVGAPGKAPALMASLAKRAAS